MTSLSIIVPVYNVATYIRECIESIIALTIKDIDIILVDDGSTDQCPDICDEYARIDSRIRVIHQENKGLVEARNVGLKEAEGKYITFVDSDDWIDGEIFLKIWKHTVLDVDMVIAGLKKEQNGRSFQITNKCESGIYLDVEKGTIVTKESDLEAYDILDLKRKAIFFREFYAPGIMPSLCVKLIKREVISQANIQIDRNIRMGEDAAMFYPLLYSSSSLVIDNENTYYHYRAVNKSMCDSFDKLYFDRLKKLTSGLYKDLENHVEAIEQLPYYVLFVVEIGLKQLVFNNSHSKKEKVDKIRKLYKDFNLVNLLEKCSVDETVFTNDQKKEVAALKDEKIDKYISLISHRRRMERMLSLRRKMVEIMR